MYSGSGSGAAKERSYGSDRIHESISINIAYYRFFILCFRTIPDMLNNLVDESDPDLDLPNIVHAYQTAERIRFLGHFLRWNS